MLEIPNSLTIQFHLEAVDGAVVGVEHDGGERTRLCSAIPTVRTVHQHAHSTVNRLTA